MLIVELPAASTAVTEIECWACETGRRFHRYEIDGPFITTVPSIARVICVTPTLSVADAVIDTLPLPLNDCPLTGDEIVTTGGVVSGGGSVMLTTLTVTLAEAPELPAASKATTLS